MVLSELLVRREALGEMGGTAGKDRVLDGTGDVGGRGGNAL